MYAYVYVYVYVHVYVYVYVYMHVYVYVYVHVYMYVYMSRSSPACSVLDIHVSGAGARLCSMPVQFLYSLFSVRMMWVCVRLHSMLA